MNWKLYWSLGYTLEYVFQFVIKERKKETVDIKICLEFNGSILCIPCIRYIQEVAYLWWK